MIRRLKCFLGLHKWNTFIRWYVAGIDGNTKFQGMEHFEKCICCGKVKK